MIKFIGDCSVDRGTGKFKKHRESSRKDHKDPESRRLAKIFGPMFAQCAIHIAEWSCGAPNPYIDCQLIADSEKGLTSIHHF
jgi:hypothetical protein